MLENSPKLNDGELLDVEDLGNVLAGAMKAQVCIGISFRSEFCKLLPHKGLAESWWKATIHIRQLLGYGMCL